MGHRACGAGLGHNPPTGALTKAPLEIFPGAVLWGALAACCAYGAAATTGWTSGS